MALLVGKHYQERKELDREWLARAVKRSTRSVKRALSELQDLGWIEYRHGGNGTSGTLKVINDMEWIMTPVSKMAPDRYQNGPCLDRIRVKEVLSKGKQAHPSKPVENPAAQEWDQIESFAAARGLPAPVTGADIERVLGLMSERKPAGSEGLALVASAGYVQ